MPYKGLNLEECDQVNSLRFGPTQPLPEDKDEDYLGNANAMWLIEENLERRTLFKDEEFLPEAQSLLGFSKAKD